MALRHYTASATLAVWQWPLAVGRGRGWQPVAATGSGHWQWAVAGAGSQWQPLPVALATGYCQWHCLAAAVSQCPVSGPTPDVPVKEIKIKKMMGAGEFVLQ